jgi:D-alanine-D-alanine ligase
VLVITGDHRLPDPTKWDGRYDAGDLELHARMRAALDTLPAYAFDFLTDHRRLIDRLRSDPPDLVLNLCDTGFGNAPARELHVPALLELLDVAYSGASPQCMVLCYDKAVVRLLARELGVPTPREVYLPPPGSADGGEHDAALDVEALYPALLKPAQGDGSVGIARDALVRTPAEARRTLAWLRRELPGRAALLQEFLPGPEYGLALVGNPPAGLVALPPLEVDYGALPAGLPPILAFESKTAPDTPYAAVRLGPARLGEEARAVLQRHAELLFARLDCRDYARFDFRTAADGEIKLLEVNPNPAWSPEAKLARMAGLGGRSYAALLELILEAARARLGNARVRR